MADQAWREGRIVVGVDGSETSVKALKWALAQAEVTGADVEALRVWEVPGNFGAPAIVLPGEAFKDAAVESLQKAVEQAVGDGDAEVDQQVVQGHAAAVLLERSKDAGLLVLGTRGHGGFVGALLGSVTQHCIHHATCPVVVIPHED
jgi:nucleotide-binding universal stress UspA family protein